MPRFDGFWSSRMEVTEMCTCAECFTLIRRAGCPETTDRSPKLRLHASQLNPRVCAAHQRCHLFCLRFTRRPSLNYNRKPLSTASCLSPCLGRRLLSTPKSKFILSQHSSVRAPFVLRQEECSCTPSAESATTISTFSRKSGRATKYKLLMYS